MASTSSPINSRKYEVFLSFRGADTRYNFTSHLYHAFCKEGVNAFMDKELRRGEEISSTLFQVIESCNISIVIFSQNYAFSKFCLDELVKILDCKTLRGQTVYPVFYNVDPFEIEKQTGNYGTALSGHEAELKGKMRIVQQWRTALAVAADLSGWDLRNRDETEVIQEIVQEVLRKLNWKIVPDDLQNLNHGQPGLSDLYASAVSKRDFVQHVLHKEQMAAVSQRNLLQRILHKEQLEALERAKSYI